MMAGDSIVNYLSRMSHLQVIRVLVLLSIIILILLFFRGYGGLYETVLRNKPGTLIIHLGTNDLTKGVNTMRKVRKCVEVIRDLDNTENI